MANDTPIAAETVQQSSIVDESSIINHQSSIAARVVIERIQPEVDGGRFPIKRTVGETVDVSATIFADGHDVLVAVLRDRHSHTRGLGSGDWGLGGLVAGDHSPITPIPNPQSPTPSAKPAKWREMPMSMT
ncbi:MAG TPA: maltotransferase domain-containing protein, partial [Vicinamibacterales bacterium]|nr:maltotransferase domain-containing protein [Vicinamibacterales bacterium]